MQEEKKRDEQRSPEQAAEKVLYASDAVHVDVGVNVSGIRAGVILREEASFPSALRLRDGRLTLGEAFSFISGLYFRGKLAYARAFAQPPPNAAGTLVITACGGLLSPETLLTREALREISSVPVTASEARYRIPLERDARLLADQTGTTCDVILLGSIATPKYVEPLLKIFGERLLFPAEFAGRGDMSRGGLMLRNRSQARAPRGLFADRRGKVTPT